jgi:hypothetical protein
MLNEQKAIEICKEIRSKKSVNFISRIQCRFCHFFARNNPKNYCFYNKQNYTGCNVINKYLKA